MSAASSFRPQYGEGFAGEGPDLAHVNTVLGLRDGPVGTAWTIALATPSAGHAPFVAVLRPGLPVKPFTLFVNKAAIAGDRHGELTWGAAQAGVAAGVANAVADGVIDPDLVDDLALVVAVWVNPSADDEAAVYANNLEATRASLSSAAADLPLLDHVLAARDAPSNPYFTP